MAADNKLFQGFWKRLLGWFSIHSPLLYDRDFSLGLAGKPSGKKLIFPIKFFSVRLFDRGGWIGFFRFVLTTKIKIMIFFLPNISRAFYKKDMPFLISNTSSTSLQLPTTTEHSLTVDNCPLRPQSNIGTNFHWIYNSFVSSDFLYRWCPWNLNLMFFYFICHCKCSGGYRWEAYWQKLPFCWWSTLLLFLGMIWYFHKRYFWAVNGTCIVYDLLAGKKALYLCPFRPELPIF